MKYFIVSEEELKQLQWAAESWGNFPPGDKERRRVKKHYEARAAACRARPVPRDATHIVRYDEQDGYLWREEIKR